MSGLSFLLLLLAAGLLGLVLGPSALSLADVMTALSQDEGAAADIVWRIRVPRIALAALVGACLSVAGVVFQALLRNPLADPYVLGVSGGAALGGIAALTLGASLGLAAGAVPLAAFAGAVLATGLLYAIANVRGFVSADSCALMLTISLYRIP